MIFNNCIAKYDIFLSDTDQKQYDVIKIYKCRTMLNIPLNINNTRLSHTKRHQINWVVEFNRILDDLEWRTYIWECKTIRKQGKSSGKV